MTAAFLVMGFGSTVGAVVMATRSEYVPALMLGAFGVASGSWLVGEYWPHGGQRVHLAQVTVRGTSQPAVVVPVRATKSRAAVVAQAAFGVVGLAIAASPGPLRLDATLLVRLFGLGIAAILAVGVRNGIRRWRRERFFLAFTASGILEEGINGWNFVPWDAIETAYRAEMYGQPLVGLKLRNPSAVEFGGGANLLRHVEQPMSGHQRSYVVFGMPVSSDWLISTIQRYVEHPEARADIGRSPLTDGPPT